MRITLLPLLAWMILCLPAAEAEGQAAVWRLVQESRLGSVDGPAAYTFTPPLVATAAADGTLFVLDRGQQQVRVFDARGRHLRTFGGEGAGPGELMGAVRLGWRGDSLWVADALQLRTTWFSREGRVLRTEGPAVRGGGGYAPAVPESMLADGSALVMPLPVQADIAAPPPTRLPILRIDRAGRADTVAWQPLRNRMMRFELRGRYHSLLQPWDDAPLLAVAPDGSGAVLVERPAATRGGDSYFRVTRLNSRGDTVYSRAYRYTPVAVAEGWRDEWLDDIAGKVAAPGSGMGRREVADAMGRVLYVPRYMPPVTAAVAGRDGTVWLRREERGSGVTWHVLDATGRIEAGVQVPAALQVLEARRTHVWGVMHDSLDVPYIHRYRIVPASPR